MKLKSNLAKRIISLISLTAILSVSLIFSSCSAVKSNEDLLTSEEWYRVYTDSYGDKNCVVIRFYSNGKVTRKYYAYSAMYGESEKRWLSDRTKNCTWELLDDDVLNFDNRYYDWKEEWKVSGDKLIIGDDTYTHKNPGIDD